MIALTTSSLFMSSCKKTKEALTDAQISTVQDGTSAEGTSQEIQSIAEQARAMQPGPAQMRMDENSGFLSSCAFIYIDSTSQNGYDTITIDFGASPCLCHDGRYRQGQIIIATTVVPGFGHHPYHTPNANMVIGFNNYAVSSPGSTDMYTFSNSSTKSVTTNPKVNGYYSWDITSNMSITKPNGGGTISYSETKHRVQFAGDPDHYRWTNKFYISGSSSGTAANGNSFTAQVASGKDLVRDMNCPKHFTQGELDITSNSNTIQIDFGTGACDKTATITKNGVTRTITLR